MQRIFTSPVDCFIESFRHLQAILDPLPHEVTRRLKPKIPRSVLFFFIEISWKGEISILLGLMIKANLSILSSYWFYNILYKFHKTHPIIIRMPYLPVFHNAHTFSNTIVLFNLNKINFLLLISLIPNIHAKKKEKNNKKILN